MNKPVVICVDDEPKILAAVRRALKNEPYELLVTDRADEALQWSGDRLVSVVMADHYMPEMTGTQLLETIGKNRPRTARVLFTGYPDAPVVLRNLGNVVQWLVSKPWNDQELRRILRTLVEEVASRGLEGSETAPGTAPSEIAEATAQVRAEIERRLGYFPPFFAPALDAPDVLEAIWHQTVSGFLDAPFAMMFKEKYFCYRSRVRGVAYCLICHCCALRSLGLTGSQVHHFLETPAPQGESDVASAVKLLGGCGMSSHPWPEPRSPQEQGLLLLTIGLAGGGAVSERCRLELQRILGDVLFLRLLLLVSYVDFCNDWSRVYSDLLYEADVRTQIHLEGLLQEEPKLCSVFAFGAGNGGGSPGEYARNACATDSR